MLHGAYNLQNWHEPDELKKMYECIQQNNGTEEKFVPLPEPIVTRWWFVGLCAVVFKETMNSFIHFGTYEKAHNHLRLRANLYVSSMVSFSSL